MIAPLVPAAYGILHRMFFKSVKIALFEPFELLAVDPFVRDSATTLTVSTQLSLTLVCCIAM